VECCAFPFHGNVGVGKLWGPYDSGTDCWDAAGPRHQLGGYASTTRFGLGVGLRSSTPSRMMMKRLVMTAQVLPPGLSSLHDCLGLIMYSTMRGKRREAFIMMEKSMDHRLLSISAERRRPLSIVVEVQRSWQCDIRCYYALMD